VGTKFYWTTDSSKSDHNISVTVTEAGTEVTYYFTSKGDGTHNMTSGAHAAGTTVEEPMYQVAQNTSDRNVQYYILNDEDKYVPVDNTNEERTYYYVADHYVISKNLIIATPYFVYNAATKTLLWTLEKISGTELIMRYFLYLERSGGHVGVDAEDLKQPGTYDTNEKATLTYDNFQGNSAQQEFPVPKVTWNGAQVTYVFYLVNEQGQPVNRAGRVVPFSEAVYITEPIRQNVYWNSMETLTRF
jgi:hypothetical protein